MPTTVVLLILTKSLLAPGPCLYALLSFLFLPLFKGERNFHILYELVAGGAASGMAKQLKVKENALAEFLAILVQ